MTRSDFSSPLQLLTWGARIALGITVLGSVLESDAAAAQTPPRVDRQLQRPAAHSFLGTQAQASTSFAERSVTLTAAGELAFDYFVDSEAGHDFLRVLVDSTQVFEVSGRNRAGSQRLPLTAGSHVVRFAYHKDTQGDVGQDTAWVDQLRISGGTLYESYEFDEPLLTVPPGFTAGGAGGGFGVAEHGARRGVRRSREGGFTGYSASGFRSAVERQLTWPSGGTRNELLVAYAVDSEEGHDFFKVFVDGTEKLSVSGRNRSETKLIDVGTAGSHTIRFEYAKDESVDEGLDDAQVLQFEVRSDRAVFEVGGFDGEKAGDVPEGWQESAGADAGWVIGPSMSPRIVVAPNDLSTAPSIDGEHDPAYRPASKFALRDSGNITGGRGEAELLLDTNPTQLFLILRAQGRNQVIGDEEGEFTFTIDADAFETATGRGCANDSFLPGPGDRRIRVAYEASSGEEDAELTIEQDAGTCTASNPWDEIDGSEAWPVSVAVHEPDLNVDEGFVYLELGVGLTSAPNALLDGMLGIFFAMESADNVTYLLPGHDGARPIADDKSTWETVLVGSVSSKDSTALRAVIDGVPRP